jgi:phenylalanine-4-hydroxylase
LINTLPAHLRKYIVEQNYSRYTPQDQAVWRHCLKRLKRFLSVNAHSSYVEGLEKTGIDLEQIPYIENISRKLEKFGWTAMPVSGFIPPAAFMELQSLGILPIASDMRSLDHLLYTPAPDIVHEAAGHAPIIVDEEYADYLREYSQVAKKSIISKEDLAVYEAIRDLSDIKENPLATAVQIKKAEGHLEKVLAEVSFVSEATFLSRMNWWTAEYGLVGPTNNPKIFGAGLLSSVGESQWCLSDRVKKIPLTLDCIHQSYDITEPQPQLFVTPSFKHLKKVLEELANVMAFKTGGIEGLEKARKSKTVNTVELNSGLQISGELADFITDENNRPMFLKFSGPTQICFLNTEVQGHGKDYHQHGYSTPLGEFTQSDLTMGLPCRFEFESGVIISGVFKKALRLSPKAAIYSVDKATVTYTDQTLFQPEWGTYDFVTGTKVSSVFGGPADREKYGLSDDFVAKVIPSIRRSDRELKIFDLYQNIRNLRSKNHLQESELLICFELVKKMDINSHQWLLLYEILELIIDRKMSSAFENTVRSYLTNLPDQTEQIRMQIADALKLIYD